MGLDVIILSMKSTYKYQSRIRILIGLFSILFGVLFILLIKLIFFTPRTLSEKDCKDCISVIQSSQNSSVETTPSPIPSPTPTPTPEATVKPTVDTLLYRLFRRLQIRIIQLILDISRLT